MPTSTTGAGRTPIRVKNAYTRVKRRIFACEWRYLGERRRRKRLQAMRDDILADTTKASLQVGFNINIIIIMHR